MILESTNFVRNGNAGLFLRKGDCVSPTDTLRPFGGGQRSFSLTTEFPHEGLSACWGWAPAGTMQLGCDGKNEQFTNQSQREFIVDATHFIAPSDGTLRLYVNPVNPADPPTLDVNVRNGCVLPTETVRYTLTQHFYALQGAFVPPGATWLDCELRLSFTIVENPAPYTWVASTTPKTITPNTLGVISRGSGGATWGIAF